MQFAESCRSLLLLIGLVAINRAVVVSAETTISPLDVWSAVFAESEQTFRFHIASSKPIEAVVRWSYSANRRTLSRDERRTDLAGASPSAVGIKLTVPPVNEGVVFATELSVGVYRTGQPDPLATLVRKIWVFPRDPFAQRKTWLDELSIVLFDPQQTTAALFDEAKIPVRTTRDVAAIGRLEKGVLIIGEAVALDDYRGLADSLLAAACRGVPVLCLAPSSGRLILETLEETPNRLLLRRNDVISEIDKRLDAHHWPGNGPLVASRFGYASYRGNVVLRTTDANTAWPWIEARYRRDTPIIVCGFALMQHWNDGPTPRYLFARLLERLTFEKKDRIN